MTVETTVIKRANNSDITITCRLNIGMSKKLVTKHNSCL